MLDESGQPDLGLDMVRYVPEEEAGSLRPPSGKEDRELFDPPLPASLRDAVRWFLVATAIRRARGQAKHSSMLIHTTHFTQPHFAMRDRVKAFVRGLDIDDTKFRQSYMTEAHRAAEVATKPLPDWDEVRRELQWVLRGVSVVVDNGSSEERLTYHRTDENGEAVIETVIAIGGATLSRGLTLEGLVVSYFNRSSNTYDTLLQMGRWFGYRPGYEDLPRIWMTHDLAEDFRFLALVEEEVRSDIHQMERASVTPDQLGVRVRSHPGRLQITGKMGVSKRVRMSFEGQRKQTFIFEETNAEALRLNLQAARDLIMGIGVGAFQRGTAPGVRWIARGVSADSLLGFFENYRFHPNQPSLRSDLVSGWIRRSAMATNWNVTVMGPRTKAVNQDEGVDLGLSERSPYVTRAPLKEPPVGTANIKALLSKSDWVADLEQDIVKEKRNQGVSYEDIRGEEGKTGLLMIFPIDPRSVPKGAGARAGSRREMKAEEPVIGVGIVFPELADDAPEYEAFYSVRADWSTDMEDIEVPEDTEDSADLKFNEDAEQTL